MHCFLFCSWGWPWHSGPSVSTFQVLGWRAYRQMVHGLPRSGWGVYWRPVLVLLKSRWGVYQWPVHGLLRSEWGVYRRMVHRLLRSEWGVYWWLVRVLLRCTQHDYYGVTTHFLTVFKACSSIAGNLHLLLETLSVDMSNGFRNTCYFHRPVVLSLCQRSLLLFAGSGI